MERTNSWIIVLMCAIVGLVFSVTSVIISPFLLADTKIVFAVSLSFAALFGIILVTAVDRI
jgi:hypothetical protein